MELTHQMYFEKLSGSFPELDLYTFVKVNEYDAAVIGASWNAMYHQLPTESIPSMGVVVSIM